MEGFGAISIPDLQVRYRHSFVMQISEFFNRAFAEGIYLEGFFFFFSFFLFFLMFFH